MRREVISLCGCRIELGSAGRGAPLMILPGAGGAALYESLAAHLSESFRVFLPQYPGFDASDDADWLERVDDLAYFHLELLDRLDVGPVTVVGHSLGGWVAAEMAIRNPRALRAACLAAPAGIRVPDVSVGDNFLWSAEETLRRLYSDPTLAANAAAGASDAATVERIFRNRQTTARLVWSPRWFNPSLGKWLHRMRMPTLLVWGEQDRLFPLAHAEPFAQLIPGSILRVIRDCGHVPFIEKPAEFLAIVDPFLREHAR
jgi:pimeloyl-ACP methyl ester carboxylesterase